MLSEWLCALLCTAISLTGFSFNSLQRHPCRGVLLVRVGNPSRVCSAPELSVFPRNCNNRTQLPLPHPQDASKNIYVYRRKYLMKGNCLRHALRWVFLVAYARRAILRANCFRLSFCDLRGPQKMLGNITSLSIYCQIIFTC